MQRYYYLSDSLEDLGRVERELHAAGFTPPQCHVFSHDDAGVQAHRLNEVEAVLKKDVVHGTELGALVGLGGAVLVLVLGWWSGLAESFTWVPVVFFALVVLGFCTWEGGLIGMHRPHADFERFQQDLENGRHILFVDFEPAQKPALQRVTERHPQLQHAGQSEGAPRWFVGVRNLYARFMATAP